MARMTRFMLSIGRKALLLTASGYFVCWGAGAAGVYTIQELIGDERLIINGVLFRLDDGCEDLRQGDAVMFLAGDPYGDCVRAQILNLRSKGLCRLECPVPYLPPGERQARHNPQLSDSWGEFG